MLGFCSRLLSADALVADGTAGSMSSSCGGAVLVLSSTDLSRLFAALLVFDFTELEVICHVDPLLGETAWLCMAQQWHTRQCLASKFAATRTR